MGYIDFHCDTLTELRQDESLARNRRHICLSDLRGAGVLVQCCAMFVPTGLLGRDAEGMPLPPPEKRQRIERECRRIYQVYEREMAQNADCLKKILSYADISACMEAQKTGILLTIEDGGVLFGEMQRLEEFYQKGVRLITLTWNHENEIGCPNSSIADEMRRGLKSFGIEAIERMSRLGIVVDVSHLSDGGFFETAAIMQRMGKPFAASHSNARAVTPHPRNLTDEMIRKIGECGGVAGLNLAPHFLNKSQPKDGQSRIEDMVRHVLHIRNVGGSEILAVGSDFDGIEGSLEIANPRQMVHLWDTLKRAGLHESELEGMQKKNALRVLQAVLG